MVIANQTLSEEQGTFVIEITKDFEDDLEHLNQSQKTQVNNKLERITTAIENNNFSYLFKHLKKLDSILLFQYTSSLYTLKISRDIRVFLFFEDDPIFNCQVMTLLRVCYRKDMERVLRGLAKSFYQQNLKGIGAINNDE